MEQKTPLDRLEEQNIDRLISEIDQLASKLNELNKELKQEGLIFETDDTPISF